MYVRMYMYVCACEGQKVTPGVGFLVYLVVVYFYLFCGLEIRRKKKRLSCPESTASSSPELGQQKQLLSQPTFYVDSGE